MTRFSKRNNKYFVCLTMVLMFTLTVITGCSSANTSTSKADNKAAEVTTEEQGLNLPYELEDGKLTVNSIFQSDVDNPDCNNEYADDIATIELQNHSQECLVNGEITVTMIDGTKISFVAEYLPAGETMWVFSKDNTGITDTRCKDIQSKCEFSGDIMANSNKIKTEVDDINITMKNISENNLDNITVFCHCNLNDNIYGGLVYKYTVDVLSTGETTKLSADDCYLGTVEIVNVECTNN